MKATAETPKKRMSSRRYHVLRVITFVLACVFAVVGMLTLTMSGDKQIRSETVSGEITRSEAQANVLLIMSYTDADVLTPLARDGFLDVMNRSAVAVDVEYMDAINCPKGSAAYQSWADTLAKKLADRSPYHAIICCDDEALTFVEDQYTTLFQGLPVIFYNVNDLSHARSVAAKGYATGVVEQGEIAETIKLASKLRPDATKLLAVIDDTPSGIGDRAQFSEAAVDSGLTTEYVDASTITRGGLSQRLGIAGDDTIVFFLDAFNDVNGNAYMRDASARLVASASKQPVMGIATGGMGEGLLGASFTDPEADGQRAAEMCVQVLNGTSPSTIDLVTENGKGFVFDSAVLDKFNIPISALPNDAVVVNQSEFTLDSVRTMLPAIGLILLAVILVLLFAFMGYQHAVRNTREIIAQSNDLRRRFYHDQLTEKPNMQWFRKYTADPENEKRLKSLIGLDFVDFSDINGSYGRAIGDLVLCEFANRFENVPGRLFVVRSTGAIFLLGFDHAIVSDGPELAEINRTFTQPVVIDETEIEVSAHVGVANISEAGTITDMVIGIDLTIRESKKNSLKNAPVFYKEQMKLDMQEKIAITALLKQSIKEETFVVLYQPQVYLAMNQVSGYEALIRMAGDAYYPGQFIPVAEMAGLVIEIDRVVTKKVVQQLALWASRGERVVPVAINYSAIQLKDVGYVDFLLGLLWQYGVPPTYVKIEITESLFLDDANAAAELFERLGNAGIPIALDDFGTGYTSLSRVASMPAQIVKIDKSLVDEYAVRGKERFLENLIRLVHDLGKAIIVEGVETADQLQICRELGCDVVQGYYYSKPLPPEDAALYLPE